MRGKKEAEEKAELLSDLTPEELLSVKLLREKYGYGNEKINKMLLLNREAKADREIEDEMWKGYDGTRKVRTSTQKEDGDPDAWLDTIGKER